MDGVLEIVLFVGFLYWMFPSFFNEGVSRLTKMVDIVTNRLFDPFNKVDPRDGHVNNEPLSTLSHLKRFSSEKKFKHTLNREAENKVRESHLYEIKENALTVNISKRRPLMGLSCYSCTPNSRQSLVNKATANLGLNNILHYTPAKIGYGFIQKTFSHLSQVYELKRFDYPQLAGTVEKDERLKQAVQKTALEQFQDSDKDDDEFYQQLIKNNEKRARKLLYDMRSTLSDFLLRLTSWVLYKLLPCFLSSVVVPHGQIDMLKKAGSTNLPLIFLPLHRSHLDYILITFILLNNNVRSPLVAAGDNLRIPFFGSLLRGLGAFFIKRRIDPIMGRKDHLYKAVLHTYMNECLRAGHNIEFFLEGGRTRTGKPCMPKYGILSVIVDSFMDGTIEDALLVPVSVNYEKLVDGNFIREQLGQAKEMETFGNAIKGIWHVLNSNYGMMRIDFNQPFSLRELVKTFNTSNKIIGSAATNKKLISNPSTTSLYGTDVVSDEHKTLVEAISKHVLYDCAQSTTIMSTNALAFLLLNKFRDGANIEDLILALDELRHDLTLVKKDVGFTGDSIDVILYAIELLGPAVVRKERINNEEILKPVAMLPNVIELTYYSNTVVAHYAIDSLIATSLLSMDLSNGLVNKEDLLEQCQELSGILQYEFMFSKPCQDLDSRVSEALDYIILKKQIFKSIEVNENTLRSRRMAEEFDDDSDEDRRDIFKYELNANEDVKDYLEFLKGLIMPLLEAYVTTAFCLDRLVGRNLLESELVSEIMAEMKLGLKNQTLKYEESVSVDSIKNAFKLLQKWDVLECHSEKKLRLYYLRENYDSSESLKAIYDRINTFRIASFDSAMAKSKF